MLLVLSVLVAITNCFVLTESTLLLPINLERDELGIAEISSEGCFQWIVLDPTYVRIIPLENGRPFDIGNLSSNNGQLYSSSDRYFSQNRSQCVSAIYVVAGLFNLTNTTFSRSSTSVIAFDKTNERRVQYEIVIDEIHHVEMATTTREIHRNRNEILEVMAFDSLGNRFSSLHGLSFQWEFVNTSQKEIEIVRTVNFPQSFNKVHHSVIDLESKGKKGNQLLITGVSFGSVNVTVHFNSLISSPQITLSVVVSLSLVPSSAIVLIGSQIDLKLSHDLNDKQSLISLPSPLYELQTMTNSATISENGNFVAVKPGVVKILGIRKTSSRRQSEALATIQICEDFSISFTFISKETKSIVSALIAEREYYIRLNVLAEGFDLSEFSDFYFSTQFGDCFSIVEKSEENRSSFYVRAAKLNVDNCIVKASLLSNHNCTFANPKEFYHKIQIFMPITLPFENYYLVALNSEKKHSSLILAKGGSQRFRYHTDSKIIKLSEQGSLNALAKGNAIVTIIDEECEENVATMLVNVYDMIELDIDVKSLMCFVGQKIHLTPHFSVVSNALRVSFGNTNINQTLTSISDFPLSWSIERNEKKSFQLETQKNLSYSCMGEGEADLTFAIDSEIIYKNKVYPQRVSVPFRSFSPITLKDKKDVSLIALNSFASFEFIGGSSVENEIKVLESGQNFTDYEIYEQSYKRYIRVFCSSVGVKHLLIISQLESQQSSGTIDVECVLIDSFTFSEIDSREHYDAKCLIKLFDKLSLTDSSYNENYDPKIVSVGTQLLVKIIPFDKTKRKIEEYSSAMLSIKSTQPKLLLVERESLGEYLLTFPEKGNSTISIQFGGYRNIKLHNENEHTVTEIDKKQIHVPVKILGQIDVELSELELFFGDSNSTVSFSALPFPKFTVQHTEATTNGMGCVVASLMSNSKLTVRPLSRNCTSKVILEDECYPNFRPKAFYVNVFDAESILLKVKEPFVRIENEIRVSFEIFDTRKRELLQKHSSKLSFEIIVDNDSFKVLNDKSNLNSSEVHCSFVLQCVKANQAIVYVVAKTPTGHTIMSNRIELFGYKPYSSDSDVAKVYLGKRSSFSISHGIVHQNISSKIEVVNSNSFSSDSLEILSSSQREHQKFVVSFVGKAVGHFLISVTFYNHFTNFEHGIVSLSVEVVIIQDIKIVPKSTKSMKLGQFTIFVVKLKDEKSEDLSINDHSLSILFSELGLKIHWSFEGNELGEIVESDSPKTFIQARVNWSQIGMGLISAQLVQNGNSPHVISPYLRLSATFPVSVSSKLEISSPHFVSVSLNTQFTVSISVSKVLSIPELRIKAFCDSPNTIDRCVGLVKNSEIIAFSMFDSFRPDSFGNLTFSSLENSCECHFLISSVDNSEETVLINVEVQKVDYFLIRSNVRPVLSQGDSISLFLTFYNAFGNKIHGFDHSFEVSNQLTNNLYSGKSKIIAISLFPQTELGQANILVEKNEKIPIVRFKSSIEGEFVISFTLLIDDVILEDKINLSVIIHSDYQFITHYGAHLDLSQLTRFINPSLKTLTIQNDKSRRAKQNEAFWQVGNSSLVYIKNELAVVNTFEGETQISLISNDHETAKISLVVSQITSIISSIQIETIANGAQNFVLSFTYGFSRPSKGHAKNETLFQLSSWNPQLEFPDSFSELNKSGIDNSRSPFSHNVVLRCELDIVGRQWASVVVNSTNTCLIRPRSFSSAQLQTPPEDLSLSVFVSDRARTYSTQKKFSIPFIPPISVSAQNVKLTAKKRAEVIQLLFCSSNAVASSGDRRVKVSTLTYSNGTCTFTITADENESFSDVIVSVNDLEKQQQLFIRVSFTQASSFYQLFFGIVIFVIVLLLIDGAVFVFQKKKN